MDVHLGRRSRVRGLRTEALRCGNNAAGTLSTYLVCMFTDNLVGRRTRGAVVVISPTLLRLLSRPGGRLSQDQLALLMQKPTAAAPPLPPLASLDWLQPCVAACRQDRIACRRRGIPKVSQGHRKPQRSPRHRAMPGVCSKRSTSTRSSLARRSERGLLLFILLLRRFRGEASLRRRLPGRPAETSAEARPAAARRSASEALRSGGLAGRWVRWDWRTIGSGPS